MNDPVTLTEQAAAKVGQFLDEAGENLPLRIAVQAGGCAGFRYALYFDDRTIDGDIVSMQHGITTVIDPQSAIYLQGATVDWKESLQASGFSVDNPNSSGTCACGESASI